jgi:DNA primase
LAYIDYESIDIKEILTFYGMRNIRELPEEVNFSCPFPNHRFGDRNPSAYINKKTGQFNCFSCGEHGSLVSFISRHEGISYDEAQGKLNLTHSNFKSQTLKDALEKAVNREPPKGTVIPEETLSLFDVDWRKVYEYYEKDAAPRSLSYPLKRGLTPDTLTQFRVGYDKHSSRITIPIRDGRGNLVGFKGRATKEEKKPKYRSVGDRPGDPPYYGFPHYKKAEYVFGLDSAKDDLIIVEGEFDVMKMRQYGFEGAIALSGSDPSPQQIEQIASKADIVTLLLDRDKAGEKAERICRRELLKYVVVRIAHLDQGDPDENSEEQIHRALSSATNALSTI